MARVLEKIDIGLMKPEEAEGVADLFRAFYGEEYPVKTFYDPEALIAENTERKIISVVARNEAHKIVGHAALYISSPYEKLYELGAILVHPECQGRGIASALISEVRNLAEELKIAEGILAESVCNHIHTQKLFYRLGGFVETAFEVDLMPAEAYDKSGAAKGRVSTIISFRKIEDTHRQVFVPARFKEQFEYIYRPLKELRSLENAPCCAIPASGSKSSGKIQFFEFANTSRVTVFDIGEDFADYISGIENDSRRKGGVIFQFWLPLDSPEIEHSVDILKKNGYFFGGVLPLWNNCDSFLMQKVENDTDWDSQHIFSERGKKIFKMVRSDAELESTRQ